MNNPLVSIVMAAYNEENYIAAAINSILTQTYSNFEFIIINDGSTDKTESIILSFQDKRIKYLKNDSNLNLINTLNTGILEAKGKYIARMDADDESLPNRLEKQVSFMETHPEIGLSGAQLKVFGLNTGTMSYPLNHEDILLHLFITSPFGNNVVIFRRDLLIKHSLFFSKEYLHAEDYMCWCRWSQITECRNLPDTLVKYRSHNNSVSIKHRAIQRATRNRIRKEYAARVFNLKETDAERLTGPLNIKRIKAIKYILKLNKERKIFDEKKLQKTLIKLWYLDSLEEAEKEFSPVMSFPLLGFTSINFFKLWLNVTKHYFKFRFFKNE